MKVYVCKDSDEAADLVANEILSALEQKPNLVLGLATGSTPIGVYHRLVEAYKDGKADFSKVVTFNLDEYIGLEPGHPQSYHFFMEKHLFSNVNIERENTHFPPTQGPDLKKKCLEFEKKIKAAGGIDIQLLGIGSNGHIGFNEPTSSLASRTRVKTLTEKTLRDNSRFYGPGEKQPTMATTMGIGTILEAKSIILQAFGKGKSEAIKACVEGPITSFWPGSILQMHKEVSLYLDQESASLLSMKDYYKRAWENQWALEKKGLL